MQHATDHVRFLPIIGWMVGDDPVWARPEDGATGAPRHNRPFLAARATAFALLLPILAALFVAAPVASANALVINCASSGAGSLPDTVAGVSAGVTIVFNQDCTGASAIILTSTIAIGKNLTIDATASGHHVTVDGGCTFSNGQCTSGGVTVFAVNSGTVTLAGLTIQHGSGTDCGGFTCGGGIFNNGTLTVTNSTFSENSANFSGGGIVNSSGTLTVINSTFINNSSNVGGGIYNQTFGTTMTVTNSAFINNSANAGGGIDNNGATFTVTNSTFSGNSAIRGGGISQDRGGITMTNCTIANNSASGTAGGIYKTLSSSLVTNTIIAGNSAPSGSPDADGSITSGGHNLVGKTDGSSGWVASDRTGTVASPLSANLGPLASYGGPTQTFALLPGSPALDAGDPTVCAGASVNSLDQRGITRPQPVGGLCDIGAFEARFTLTVASGSPQSTQVTQVFAAPLVVAFGGPDAPATLSGVTVTFTAPASDPSATLLGNPATTNASGQAGVIAQANGAAGSYNVTASTPGAAATFALTNTPRTAQHVTANSGATPQSTMIQTAFSTPLAVTVTDGTGTGVPGLTITFTAPAIGASGTFANITTTTTATTDASGVATASAFTANSAQGSYTVTAATDGGGLSATFNLSNLAGSASSVTPIAGAGQQANVSTAFATPLQAVLRDAVGNPVSGATVTFTAPATGASGTFGGSGTTVQVTTSANGVATAPMLTANQTAGAYSVTATAAGVATPASFSLTNTPGPVASLAVAGFPASTVAGVAHTFTVTAKDAGGNTVTGYTGTVHVTSSDAQATLPANYTFTAADQGVHTFMATLKTVGSGRTITATDSGNSVNGTQTSIAVTPAVLSVSPINGPQAGGGAVTITGIGLTSATSVTLGSAACTNVQVNGAGTSLTCTAPTNQAAGTVDVVVTTPNGTGTLTHGYTSLPASVAPAPASGGRGGSGGGNGGGAAAPSALPANR